MSLHYLLDGYNIINQMPMSNLTRLEDQRGHLLHFMEQTKPQGSRNNQVTVIFDGGGPMPSPSLSSAIKVTFSQEESADEKIKRIVSEAPNKKNIVVVTDDRDIQYAVCALGAKIMSVQEFLNKPKGTKEKAANKKKRQQNPADAKRISRSKEFEITSEFKKIWLHETDSS